MKTLSRQYAEYMQSDAWNKKRKACLKRDGYTCQRCGAKDTPLDAHHKTYARFGRERPGDLETLCRPCHEREHENERFDFCRTCGRFLKIFIKRIKIFGTPWTDYTCEDGHTRSYRDESSQPSQRYN